MTKSNQRHKEIKKTAKSKSRTNRSTRSSSKWFYERNSTLIEHRVNRTFEEILWMPDKEFREWVSELRQLVLDLWDKKDIPPCQGNDEHDIVKQFDKLSSTFVESFLVDDAFAGTKNDVIHNTALDIGSAANQWFPTMMKTKINYSLNLNEGKSIYDYFQDEELFLQNCRKLFKRDSPYNYSIPVPPQASDLSSHLYRCKSGRDWIKAFEKNEKEQRQTHDYWIEPKKPQKQRYRRRKDDLADRKELVITKDELNQLPIPRHCRTNISHIPDAKEFRIRIFKKGQRLFPTGFDAFKKFPHQCVVNFPPLTARFLYERYLKKLGTRKATIWDPSAGWGGRILGAMALSDYEIHYIGTDPNEAHTTKKPRTKYHELADFYLRVARGERPEYVYTPDYEAAPWLLPKPKTYEIYQCGSEVMRKQSGFRAHKGKVDIVFTSPPYFGKEIYSQDSTQSANKFREYNKWRDRFLKPTLETAVEWLKPGGFLLWNIANVQFSGKVSPLEEDSCRFLDELGMEKVEVLKMTLAPMSGANRTDSDNEQIEIHGIVNDNYGSRKVTRKYKKPTTRHFCAVASTDGERLYKFEPIFIFRKPQSAGEKGRRKIGSYYQARDLTLIGRHLEEEFRKAIDERQINPNRLRAIYDELERKIYGPNGTEIYSHFYSTIRDKRIRYVPFMTKQKGSLRFVDWDLGERGARKFLGQYALIQLPKAMSNRRSRLFAWGKIVSVNNPDEWTIKILSDKQYAEDCIGRRIKTDVSYVLRIADSPAPMLYQNFKWDFTNIPAT